MIATIIILGLMFMNLDISMAKNGKVEVKKHSFLVNLASTIITLILFYYAGLFDCFK